MSRNLNHLCFMLLFWIHAVAVSGADSTMYYSGSLSSGDVPLNGEYDFQFGLYDEESNGNQVGTTVSLVSTVDSGAFNVTLDFGPTAFRGATRWLQLAVKRVDEAAFTTLNPRTAIAPVPHSQFAVVSDLATSAAYALRADTALESDLATTATYAVQAETAQVSDSASTAAYALAAGTALVSDSATTATYAIEAETANLADSSTSAAYAEEAGTALVSDSATTAAYALNAGAAVQANFANSAGHAASADIANSLQGLTPEDLAGVLWEPVSGETTAAANHRYMVTGMEDATISLPANPAIGDRFNFAVFNGRGSLDLVLQPGQSFPTYKYPTESQYYSQFSKTSNITIPSLYILGSDDDQYLVGYSTGGNTVLSSDGGATWAEIAPRTHSAAISGDASTIFLGQLRDFDYEMRLSKDRGNTWETSTPAHALDTVCCSADGMHMYGMALGAMLLATHDGGQSWNWIQLPVSGNWYLGACSEDGQKLFVHSGFGGAGTLYTSTDGGSTWNPATASGGYIGTSKYGERIYTQSGANLYLSTDWGQTWTDQGEIPLSDTGRHMDYVSRDGTIVLARDENYSFDEGKTWVTPKTSVPTFNLLYITPSRFIYYNKNYREPYQKLFEDPPYVPGGTVDWSNHHLTSDEFTGNVPVRATEFVYIGDGQFVPFNNYDRYHVVGTDGF